MASSLLEKAKAQQAEKEREAQKAYTTTEVENYKVPEIEDFVSEHFCCDVEEYLRLMELRNFIFSKRLSA